MANWIEILAFTCPIYPMHTPISTILYVCLFICDYSESIVWKKLMLTLLLLVCKIHMHKSRACESDIIIPILLYKINIDDAVKSPVSRTVTLAATSNLQRKKKVISPWAPVWCRPNTLRRSS